MKHFIPLLTALLLTSQAHLHAAAPDLSKITSQADLDAVIAATADATLKQSLADQAAAILAAAEQHLHVEAVIRTIESAPGTFMKINTTPDSLKKAAGGDIALFDTLTMVNTGILNGHAHASRDKKTDPYNAAFIEHLGQIPSLENLSVVVTALEESSLDAILKLKRLQKLRIEKRYDNGPGDTALAKLSQLATLPDLKSLSLHYFSKATDAGLEHLAGLKTWRASASGQTFQVMPSPSSRGGQTSSPSPSTATASMTKASATSASASPTSNPSISFTPESSPMLAPCIC